MQDSIFTKIIKGEIPSHKIYEDETVLAFLDIRPITTGHTLVIPKKQVEFVWDLDDQAYAELTNATKKIALHLRTTLGVHYIAERIVGVDVPHAHIQLIPFTDVSELHAEPDATSDPDHAALARVAERLSL